MASVQVCLPSRDGRFDRSVVASCYKAVQAAQHDGIEADLVHVDDRYNVATCRNKGIARFLRTSFTHLLFVDDDVLIPANAVTALVAVTERTKGIASGCIPSIKVDPEHGTMLYVQVHVNDKWFTTWPKEDTECEIVGGGCMLIPREIFAAVGFPWFKWTELHDPEIGHKSISDDSDFCMRARMAGYTVTAAANVRCGHGKQIDVGLLIGE